MSAEKAGKEIEEWCKSNGFDGIADGLKEHVECLDDLRYTDDDDVKEIIKALGMAMKQKIAFRRAIASLKQVCTGVFV